MGRWQNCAAIMYRQRFSSPSDACGLQGSLRRMHARALSQPPSSVTPVRGGTHSSTDMIFPEQSDPFVVENETPDPLISLVDPQNRVSCPCLSTQPDKHQPMGRRRHRRLSVWLKVCLLAYQPSVVPMTATDMGMQSNANTVPVSEAMVSPRLTTLKHCGRMRLNTPRHFN